ncbi:MAG: FAD-dependent thymidylate synthase [Spirochaetales bacterium]|nr:FAD-dependent thymidylate synthase [Spirochaetales bacterium]
MAHIRVQEAEDILDKETRVLDHGFVRLVDYLGGDARIVQAARVSYGSGTKTVREDKKLINYLLRNEHMSPFEQVIFTFHLKMPIFVARQWVRHRTARMNEISGRYSVMEDEFYLPREEDIRFQSQHNRQGRSEEEVPSEMQQEVLRILKKTCETAYDGYRRCIGDNISREISRIILPLSLYTQMYWQIDLRNLLHFIKLRADIHAQQEIRQYADVLGTIVKTVTPAVWEAFDEYELRSRRFTPSQLKKIHDALKETHPELIAELGLHHDADQTS